MIESSDKSHLPQVEDCDLNTLLFEDITDPTHKKRWNDFAAAQPELARELLKRTFEDTRASLGFVSMQKILIDTISYTYSALDSAAQRHSSSSSDGDDGANQLPSGELGDDQPTG